MNPSIGSTPNRTALLTYIPRVLSGLVLLAVGGFMAAYFVGGEETSSRALTPADHTILAALVTSLVGLAAAWKWERLGATITLAAVAVGTAFNWHFITSPLLVIPIAALLFLLCAWLKNIAASPSQA
jgi:hypothetical protein